MVKKTLLILPACFLIVGVFGTGQLSAQGNSQNASVGTKELLTRIEALEAAIANLGDASPDVSGRSYNTFTLVTGLGALTPQTGTGQFHVLGTLVRVLSFNPDGTGDWTTVDCFLKQLSAFGNNDPFIEPVRSGGCDVVPANRDITWIQAGSQVEVTFTNSQISTLLRVSPDGNMLTTTRGDDASNPIRQFVQGLITVGVATE